MIPTAEPAVGVPPSTALRSRLYWCSAAGLVILSLALKLWAMRQWSWFQDDWSYVEATVDLHFWQYVSQDYNGHFMPVQFAIVWGITGLSPLNFDLAILVLLVLIAGGLLAWWRLFERLFGRRPQVLVGLAIIGFTPLLIQPTLWWASGLQTYGLVAGTGLVLLLALEYMSSGRRVWLAVLLVALLLTLLSWQKNLLILIPLAFLIFVLPGLDRGSSEGRMRSLRLGLGVLVVTAAYLAAYLYFTREAVPGDAQLGFPAIEPLAGFALTAGLGILLPAAIGGTWEPVGGLQGSFPMAATWLQWSLGAASIALAVLSITWRRRAVWIIVMLAAYSLAAWALVVGSTRFGNLGQFASLDARYSADIIPVLALSFVYLTTSTVGERKLGSAWLYPIGSRLRTAWHTACAVSAMVIVASSLATWSIQMDTLGRVSPRSWVDNLLGSAKTAGAASVFNSNAPDNVVYPAFLPADARVARMLAPLGTPLAFDVAGEPMLAANDRGELVPAIIDVRTASAPGPAAGCGYVVDNTQWTFIPLDNPLYAWNWGFELAYFAKEPMRLEVRAPQEGEVFDAPDGVHDIQGVLVSEMDTLAVRSVTDGTACVTGVVVGFVEAGDSTS